MWAILTAVLMFGGPASAPQPGADDAVEATSLLDAPLKRPPISPERRAKLENDLSRAKADFEANPGSESAAIWYGRRLAYLGRYQEAIEIFSIGLRDHPGSYRLLRHRGHRLITLRRFDDAIVDLKEAGTLAEGKPDQIEPDGAPNSKNIPRSTDQSNIWYHLALACYLKGDFPQAAKHWDRCLEYSRVNDDLFVATSYWLYLSLRRSGDMAAAAKVLAPIRSDMDIIENDSYHRLLLLFKGQLTEAQVEQARPDDGIADATIGYGIGAWKLINDDAEAANASFRRALSTENWAAFGCIAAEAEIARSK